MIADRIVILDSNPGRVKGGTADYPQHPRDYTAPVFRRLVERVYEIMTTAAGEPRTSGIGHRLPSAHVAQLLGALDEISHPVYQGLVNLSALANALELKVDDLFPDRRSVAVAGFGPRPPVAISG